MKKIITDRINALKSERAQLITPKLDKVINQESYDELGFRIDELERLKKKCITMYTRDDMEDLAHTIVNDSICKPGYIKHRHSNACAQFVNKWLETFFKSK